jgi:D-amino-acid dehydrogenase
MKDEKYMKAYVIGAGITGITTAYSLAKRGVDVTVIEAQPYAAMMTSYANGGQLSVSNSDVWTTWSNVFKAAKWVLRKDAPLLINPSFSLSKYRWLYKFLETTATGKAEINTKETIKIGLAAREIYFKIAEEEKIDFDLTKKGILHFYKDEKYFEQAKRSCQLYWDLGVDRELLTANQVRSIEPSLGDSTILGGVYTPGDANGDIHKFCINLSEVLKNKYNVKFIYNFKLSSLDKVSSNDTIVLCAGVESAKLSRLINDPLDIYPVKGYSITIDVGTSDSAPTVSLLDDEAKIVSSRLGNRFRVAGTAEINGYNYDIRKDRVDPLVSWVKNNFNGISTEHVVPWAGLRPMTPNMLPIVRRSKVPNIWYNTGHGHLGWTLGAATAETIAENILG